MVCVCVGGGGRSGGEARVINEHQGQEEREHQRGTHKRLEDKSNVVGNVLIRTVLRHLAKDSQVSVQETCLCFRGEGRGKEGKQGQRASVCTASKTIEAHSQVKRTNKKRNRGGGDERAKCANCAKLRCHSHNATCVRRFLCANKSVAHVGQQVGQRLRVVVLQTPPRRNANRPRRSRAHGEHSVAQQAQQQRHNVLHDKRSGEHLAQVHELLAQDATAPPPRHIALCVCVCVFVCVCVCVCVCACVCVT